MKRLLYKYWYLIIVITLFLLVQILYPQMGRESLIFSGRSFCSFLLIIIPIFICIGLLDVWVEREMLVKVMGEKSGTAGVLVAYLLGLVTAVPLYALLPVAGILLKKGSKLSNVLIFLCSCTSIRIPLLLFLATSLGLKYALATFILNTLAVVIIAFTIEKVLTEDDMQSIYANVRTASSSPF